MGIGFLVVCHFIVGFILAAIYLYVNKGEYESDSDTGDIFVGLIFLGGYMSLMTGLVLLACYLSGRAVDLFCKTIGKLCRFCIFDT